MPQESPKTIVLKGDLGRRHEEAVAAEAITPGMMIEIDANLKAAKHSTAGEVGRMKAFAKEDALRGKTIDDDYAADDVVPYHIAQPGDVIYAWLADGEDITQGDQLESNGDGTLAAVSGTAPNEPVAQALESVDLSVGTATAIGRIKVRVV